MFSDVKGPVTPKESSVRKVYQTDKMAEQNRRHARVHEEAPHKTDQEPTTHEPDAHYDKMGGSMAFHRRGRSPHGV